MQAVINALNAAVDILDATGQSSAAVMKQPEPVNSIQAQQDIQVQPSVAGSQEVSISHGGTAAGEPMVQERLVSTYSASHGGSISVRYQGPVTGRAVNMRV